MNTETNTKGEHTTLIDRLFKAGAHFGFTKSRRHPTVKPYLFGNKQGTDIFDLEKTAILLDTAKQAMREAGKNGKQVLFVGTKEEISSIVGAAAEQAKAPYVMNRWIGGMLTNFSEMKKRIQRLGELNQQRESGELERKYTKKERVLLGREVEKLNFNFGGVATLERMPSMLVVVDPRHDSIAVEEAITLKIPVIGISSSDGNLRNIAYPVVVNDALRSSVELVLGELVLAYEEGKAEYTPPQRPERARRG